MGTFRITESVASAMASSLFSGNGYQREGWVHLLMFSGIKPTIATIDTYDQGSDFPAHNGIYHTYPAATAPLDITTDGRGILINADFVTVGGGRTWFALYTRNATISQNVYNNTATVNFCIMGDMGGPNSGADMVVASPELGGPKKIGTVKFQVPLTFTYT